MKMRRKEKRSVSTGCFSCDLELSLSPWRSVESLMKCFDRLWPMIESGKASTMVEKEHGFMYEVLDGM